MFGQEHSMGRCKLCKDERILFQKKAKAISPSTLTSRDRISDLKWHIAQNVVVKCNIFQPQNVTCARAVDYLLHGKN